MSKKKILLIIAGVIAIGITGYLSLASDGTKRVEVNAAEVASRDIIEVVTASGRIQPQTKVDITSEINGEIVSLLVQEGASVTLGQPLVVLDTVQLKTDVDQAKFAVLEVTARLEGFRATLDQRTEDFDIQKKLYEDDHSSETELRNARYAYLSAKSGYEATAAQAKQFESRYEKQLDYLSKARIVAPMSGTVTFLDCEVGEIAAAQSAFSQGRTLMTIADLDVFEVEVEVDETEISKVMLGQEAGIEVDAFPDTVFVGEVVEIGNTAIVTGIGSQDQSTNFNVKVLFKDSNDKIRPGMSATVDLTTNKQEGVLAVPFSAIVMRTYDLDSLRQARLSEEETSDSSETDDLHAAEIDSTDIKSDVDDDEKERAELKGVFVINDGTARFIEVETGIADQKNIEIVSGLSASDSVITGPYRSLRTISDGDGIKIKPSGDKKD